MTEEASAEPLNPMPPEMLAALKADLAVSGRWMMIGVHVSGETSETPSETPGAPPAVSSTRHVTATLQCRARSLTLVAMLTGPAEGPAEALKIHYAGTPFETDDAALIAQIESKVEPMIAFRAAELVAKLTAPVTESQP